MTKSLWTRLALPLVLLSVASLALHHWWDYDGFLVNLATSLLSIIVTVFYVDWVLWKNESQRWSGTDIRISKRLEVFVNAFISGIRSSLNFSHDIMDESVLMTGDNARVHREVLRIAEHVLAPAARTRLGQLDEVGWRSLSRHLQSVWAEADRLLDRFSNRLHPRQIELLLDIQATAQYALTFYQTFPDLAGVPPERLPQTKTPPGELQSFGYDSTAKELRRLLGLARELADAEHLI